MKKFLPYILILVTLFGLFGLSIKAEAQSLPGVCVDGNGTPVGINPATGKDYTESECSPGPALNWKILDTGTTGTTATGTTVPSPKTGLENNLPECFGSSGLSIGGCLSGLFYFLFITIPSWLLALAAYFFNSMLAIGISDKLFSQATFVNSAWGVVRDLSNVFFIIILLFVAFEMILGMSHDAKKTIVNVVIAALLINFSMFFTKVVIDTSNVLALVFYNKLTVETNVNGVKNFYVPGTSVPGEKDISGALVNAFRPDKLLSEDFFKKVKENPTPLPKEAIKEGPGGAVGVAGSVLRVLYNTYLQPIGWILSTKDGQVPQSILLGIMLTSGLIMLFAVYCFVVAGLSFLARLLELWIMIIFSPFAFMSFSFPKFSGASYIGWDNWSKRLIDLSFMAPIFMFFMYFIFLLVRADIFGNLARAKEADQTVVESVLFVIIPALVILVLLLKATEYAKKTAGKIGEATIGAAKMLAGLAVGGVALGTAGVSRAVVGATAKYVQNNNARDSVLTFKDTREKYGRREFLGAAGSAIKTGVKWAPAAFATVLHGGRNLSPTGQVQSGGIGKKMQEAEVNRSHKTHASHVLEGKTQSMHDKDTTYSSLTEAEQEKIREAIDKDEISKFIYKKAFNDLKDRAHIQEIEDRYNGTYSYTNQNGQQVNTGAQRAIVDHHGKTIGVGDNLNNVFNANNQQVLDANGHPVVGDKFASAYIVDTSKVNSALGEFSMALRKGSYDLRKLADMKGPSKGFPKLAVGLLNLVAAGVRMGIKDAGGVNYGTPQKDFFKDIGNTISEALKSVKINVDLSGGGHGGGSAKSNGGHGGGGHGGGHH